MDFNNALWEINRKVVFVKGALRGAIYDLENELVYSIGEQSCNCLYKIIVSYTMKKKSIVRL